MVGYLSKKPKLSFVDDPGKLYRQRRRATRVGNPRFKKLKDRRNLQGNYHLQV
jgi:hypothetical protein